MSHLPTASVCMLQMGLGKTVQAASFLGACILNCPVPIYLVSPIDTFVRPQSWCPNSQPHRRQVPDACLTLSCHDNPALQGIPDNSLLLAHTLAL